MRLQHLKLLFIAIFFVVNPSWAQDLPNSVEKCLYKDRRKSKGRRFFVEIFELFMGDEDHWVE